MRILLWAGLVVLALGIASLFVAVPKREMHAVKAGDYSIGIQTQHKEKVSPVISAVVIIGGVSMMVAGLRAR